MSYRIVSLCPSTTQTLKDLGLENQIVGRTRFCQDPCKKIRAVGGTKNPKWDVIATLEPTHILFNLEENDYTHLSQAQAICETVVHTPVSIEDSKQFVLDLGDCFDQKEKAISMADDIDSSLSELTELNHSFTYLYFIWHRPNRRVASRGTFIDAMLSAAGGNNLASSFSDERYPLWPDDFEGIADIVLLSSEPYPFKEKHIDEYSQWGRQTLLIDGEPVCWHGSRTAEGLQYLTRFVKDHVQTQQ